MACHAGGQTKLRVVAAVIQCRQHAVLRALGVCGRQRAHDWGDQPCVGEFTLAGPGRRCPYHWSSCLRLKETRLCYNVDDTQVAHAG